MKKLFVNAIHSNVWVYGLFWAWNGIFLAFLLLGFAPLVLPSLFIATQANLVPISFVITALLLLVIPLAAVGLGITVLRREPRRLFALGYAVEGPLMLLVALRLFVVRELTTILAFIFAVAALGMLTFVWQLLDKKIETRGGVVPHMRLLGLSLFVLVALYAGIWLAFYAIPLGALLIRGLFDLVSHLGDFFGVMWRGILDFPRNALYVPFLFFGMLSFAFSATLFVLMPVAVPVLVLRTWWRAIKSYSMRFGMIPAALVTTATVGVCAFLFVFLNQQPQATALALLETTPTSTARAQELAAQEGTIRSGLLNAYLAPQRYISAVGQVTHVREMYAQAFNSRPENFVGVESAYQVVASPLLYKPVGQAEPNARGNNDALLRESNRAAQLYKDYFDESIFDGERETVLTALGSTWDAMGAQQAVQDAADREVHLNKQEIRFTEHGDWADFQLHEEYQNESGQRQEVVYYITLPESAVITGVWLGNTDNRDEASVYRVSPRGAAQQVYRQQVRRNIDPALVEQIGPRQYRVRVFPVEPKSVGYENSDFGARIAYLRQGPPLHLWLTWRVMANENAWTFPYLAEKRNVYWDSKTVRTVNGQPFTTPVVLDTGDTRWLPATVPARSAITPAAHRFDMPDGQTVIAQPTAENSLPDLPGGLRLAVVIDRSRSMKPLAQEVENALASFKTIAQQGSQVDVYLTSSKYRGEPSARVALDAVNANALTYMGGQNPAELLEQFNSLRGTDSYDAVIVLTDGTGYALGANDANPASVESALWFVHLGGAFPLGYDDPTLETIQSTGGGVTGSASDALQRLAVALALGRGDRISGAPADATTDWVDNYVWLTLPTGEANAQYGALASEESFAPFAARRLILANIQRERTSLGQLNTLDQLHALAKQYSVISPYSSMIVLVNQTQQQQLDELEKQGDRFQRETEEVGQTTSPFDVTAVPEPHEYLLMALAAGFILWYARRVRRRSAQRA